MAMKVPSISKALNKVENVSFMGIPGGQALLLVPSIGIADGVISAVKAAVGDSTKVNLGPVSIDFLPVAVGVMMAVAMTKVKPVRNFLGTGATKALVLGAMASGLNRSTHLSGWSRYGVARLAGILGHSSPWEIIGVDKVQWAALTDKASENYATRNPAAMKAADLEGAPAQFALRPGMAAFESVPELAGLDELAGLGEYGSTISAIDRNQRGINLPSMATMA